jgi:hypothetical protein
MHNTLHVTVNHKAPHPGDDYRLITEGEVAKLGDEAFNVKDGSWVPLKEEEINDDGFDPNERVPHRRHRSKDYQPFTYDEAPVGRGVQPNDESPGRSVIVGTTTDGAFLGNGTFVTYEELLKGYVFLGDGEPCGEYNP